jgi:hypothetical protein
MWKAKVQLQGRAEITGVEVSKPVCNVDVWGRAVRRQQLDSARWMFKCGSLPVIPVHVLRRGLSSFKSNRARLGSSPASPHVYWQDYQRD